MAKFGVKQEDFLDWYFSETEDYLSFAQYIVSELKGSKQIIVRSKHLLDLVCYVPTHLLIPLNDRAEKELMEGEILEADPSECKFIY
jgi:hypothetical protein